MLKFTIIKSQRLEDFHNSSFWASEIPKNWVSPKSDVKKSSNFLPFLSKEMLFTKKKVSLEFCKNSKERLSLLRHEKKKKRKKEGHSCKLDSNKAVWHTSLGKGTMALLLPYYKYSQKRKFPRDLGRKVKQIIILNASKWSK